MTTVSASPTSVSSIRSETNAGTAWTAGGKPILVATDASPTADAAFTMARLLAHRCGANVEVVTVLEPSAMHLPASYPAPTALDNDVERMEALRERARHQISVQVGDSTGWPLDTRLGEPAPTIHRKARERDAELVIMGVSRHGLMDRLYGEETTAHVAQLTAKPLLAVASGVDRLPRTVVIALGINSPPIPTSATMRTLFSEVECVYFVNARPDPTEHPAAAPRAEPLYLDDVQVAYEAVKRSLGLPPGVVQQPVAVSGNPAKEILRFAAGVEADLIIVGQRQGWFLTRWLGTGLAARLLRSTTASVLIVPRLEAAHPTAGAVATAGGGRTETIDQRALWPDRLADISRRNRGRPATLELDDAPIGGHAQACRFPFLGMEYDDSEDQISITLGDPAGERAELTHFVVAPTCVEILEGIYGKTLALRVETEVGQALLSFLT